MSSRVRVNISASAGPTLVLWGSTSKCIYTGGGSGLGSIQRVGHPSLGTEHQHLRSIPHSQLASAWRREDHANESHVNKRYANCRGSSPVRRPGTPPEAVRESRDRDVTAGQDAQPTPGTRVLPHHVSSCLTNTSLEFSHTHPAHPLLVRWALRTSQPSSAGTTTCQPALSSVRSISLNSFPSQGPAHCCQIPAGSAHPVRVPHHPRQRALEPRDSTETCRKSQYTKGVGQCTQSSSQATWRPLPLAILTLSSEEPPTLSPHPGTAHTTLILAVPQTGSTQGEVDFLSPPGRAWPRAQNMVW